jgi:two-component system, OmpR family, sensor histidine kinase KdpD
MPAETQRASPDALLALAKRQGRGRLKIFLGASPGVGKTYAMLLAARAAKAEGRNALIGIVETHGRAETEALLEGLEVLQRKPTVYMNRIMSEFDIDAALARRPELLLLDECAHTNIPGSRHPKRWQDIEELLEAGIDVWTTLNVQHLESLNDVVQKITRVRVREKVPDSVFEEADEIVLIDLSSEELLKRLAEGKVYFKDTAARARESFFKPQNLAALRELALRRAAERVDADLVERMQAEATEGPLPAGERILACIGPSLEAPRIVRAAKRLADLMDAPWVAVFVENAGGRLSDAGRKGVDAALKLAEDLGGETRMLVGNDMAGEILRFARFENVTHIVVGQWRRGFLAEVLRRSLPHELVRRAEGIGVHFVTGVHDGSPATARPVARTFAAHQVNPLAIVWVTLGVVVALGLGTGLATLTSIPNLSMIFLLAVLFAAVAFGIWPAVYASVLSSLVLNFFFIEPLYTLTIAEPHELLSLIIFLAVSMIAATLAGRVRAQAQLGAQRVRALRRLYEFTRKLSSQPTVDGVAEAVASEIHNALSRPSAVLLERDGDLTVRAAWPPIYELDTSAMAAARWAFSHDEPAGAETATLTLIEWRFLPIRLASGPLGVVGVSRAGPDDRFDSETLTLMGTIAEQAAAALERATLTREMVTVRSAAETERVRNTLLSSVSHDFRTPLSSILGSATSLLDFGDRLSPDERRTMLVQVKQETELLDEMVRNLLAITRIDAGALELHKDWIDVQEMVNRVASNIRRRHGTANIAIDLPAELPLVHADPTLFEQALTNVVMNAVTHNTGETSVTIGTRVSPVHIDILIADDGQGISAELMPKLFDKFSRAGRSEQVQGVGLGLAIAKGIMDAHNGKIKADSPIAQGRGARFELSFPRGDGAK